MLLQRDFHSNATERTSAHPVGQANPRDAARLPRALEAVLSRALRYDASLLIDPVRHAEDGLPLGG